MIESEETGMGDMLTFEADLDASPHTVWRAVIDPALRERWLPGQVMADPEPVSETPGSRVSYRMRDDEPPHYESLATFEITPNGHGGTRLVIRHRLTDIHAGRMLEPANGNDTVMMRAA